MWKLLSPSRNGQIPLFGIKTPENDLTRVGGPRRILLKKDRTYSNLSRDQITLVQYENEMLVWCFLLEILLNRPTTCSQWVAGV